MFRLGAATQVARTGARYVESIESLRITIAAH